MEDPVVPVENSILLSEAMRKNKVKHELHLYPSGPHGMQLGYGRSDISQWPEQAAAFLYGTCGFRREIPDAEKRTVALVFDCPGKSLIKTVVPVLQKYGFYATFFTSDHPEKGHLSVADLKKLSDSGFEIGAEFSAADESSGTEQKIVKLKTFFEKQDLPAPVSFAYPGGKYDPNVCRILKKHGFRLAAETTEDSRVFDLLTGNSFRIPGCLMHYNSELLFYFAAGETGIHKLPVLLFHDIPEKRSDESLCSPEFFAARMKYLYDNGYRAVSLKDAVGK
jgi:peptidoglycan/xylan/chitin deacetylase (PgdA/CDA1 family)